MDFGIALSLGEHLIVLWRLIEAGSTDLVNIVSSFLLFLIMLSWEIFKRIVIWFSLGLLIIGTMANILMLIRSIVKGVVHSKTEKLQFNIIIFNKGEPFISLLSEGFGDFIFLAHKKFT